MSDVLHQICERKREHVAACKANTTLAMLEERIRSVSAPRGFIAALEGTVASFRPALICEIKQASPSRGVIREDFNPAQHAKDYQAGGAACLSVLTDTPYFQGDDTHLIAARNACTLPVLRKDFMLDTYQVTEARALGADCILLIMAALSDMQAQELEQAAHQLGMDVLVEVHDQQELERALKNLSTRLIGINNRDLKTLKVDLATSRRLSAHIPEDKLGVCESGIKSAQDIAQIREVNIHCFLVGESLMLQRNMIRATQQLLGN